jgi:hypothetical protein
LVQPGRGQVEGGQPQRSQQHTLETLRSLPVALSLVTGRYEFLVLLLLRRGQRSQMLFVKGSQGVNRSLVGSPGAMNPRADMEAVDMKPTELMNGLGQVGLYRLGSGDISTDRAPFCIVVVEVQLQHRFVINVGFGEG